MPEDTEEAFLFIPDLAAKAALRELLKTRIHPHFAGYLALCRIARQTGHTHALEFRAKEFFETFLRVQGLPPTTPYLLPFRSKSSTTSPFFNANVAGSYAPSSLRPEKSFRKVVEMSSDSGEALFSLPIDHAVRAKQYLAFKSSINACVLATFL